MLILFGFAFLAGLVTILSPCILPVLPIVLASSVDTGKNRPLGIVTGFIASFTFFTLTLSSIVRATGLAPDALRNAAIVIIGAFGISMLIPSVRLFLDKLLTALSPANTNSSQKHGFSGGFVIGLSLGLLWAPCVGPILASVITLAATSKVTSTAVFITLFYAIGTAIPMLFIIRSGRAVFSRIPWLLKNITHIQKLFGIIMIATALAMHFNIDRTFQTYILETFPNYGIGLTKFEDTEAVNSSLKQLTNTNKQNSVIGKPMYDVALQDLGAAPDFIPGGVWINSDPLSMKALRGKVVLIDFWTYTCINCIRTLPYIKAWNEKYKDEGLVIVGVHTPEFEFEKDEDNVRKAVKDFGLTYPIVQDNNYDTWRAYDNHYWPAKYLIDKNGKIRNTHFGEGAYDETERIIQELLEETGAQFSEAPNNEQYSIRANSPESYLGYDRIQYLVSPERIIANSPVAFSAPATLPRNTFAYEGIWTVGDQRAMPSKSASLSYHFDAGRVYLVMRPKNPSIPSAVKMYLDGSLVNDKDAGTDVKQSMISVDSDRLYTLIELEEPGNHIIKLEFLDDNCEVYAFTFG